MCKGKAVPLEAWSGPKGSRKLRFPEFMTTTHDGGKLSAFELNQRHGTDKFLQFITHTHTHTHARARTHARTRTHTQTFYIYIYIYVYKVKQSRYRPGVAQMVPGS